MDYSTKFQFKKVFAFFSMMLLTVFSMQVKAQVLGSIDFGIFPSTTPGVMEVRIKPDYTETGNRYITNSQFSVSWPASSGITSITAGTPIFPYLLQTQGLYLDNGIYYQVYATPGGFLINWAANQEIVIHTFTYSGPPCPVFSIADDAYSTAINGLHYFEVNGLDHTGPIYQLTAQHPVPDAAGTITGTSTVCQGATGISYSVPVITGATDYVWDYTGTGVTINGTGNSVTLDFSGTATSGDLTVYGENDCGDGAVSAPFAIAVGPGNTVTLSSASGTDNQTVCINNATTDITYATTGATGIGTATGLPAGVSAGWASDVITISGTPTVSGSFNYSIPLTGGCGTVDATGTITVDALPTVTAGSYGPVCADASPIALVGSPTGGIWSGTGVSGDQTSGYTFDPSSGTQTLTYSYTDINGCTSSDQTTITVNPFPTVTVGTYGPVCADASPIALVGTPTGGIWSGTGVSGDQTSGYTFDPSSGTQSLTYSYTDVNSCTSSDQTTITVNPLPTVACPADFDLCVDAGAVTLSGATPAGGTYSGPGVSGGDFDPSSAGTGIHTITYTYTDPATNCTNSCTFEITVNALPTVTCPADYTATACNIALPLGATDPATFSALGGATNGTAISYTDGTATLVGCTETTVRTYTATLNGCTSTCTQTLIRTIDTEDPVATCPPAQNFCHTTAGTYTVPVVTATDNCGGTLTYSYAITGATNRTGSDQNASGVFDIGLSTIEWTITRRLQQPDHLPD